ncbi:COG4223 family protein [Thalassovita mediterranea]|uniref:Mitochondrial inner membrane protein n=1 Tax=Thalassovita mediterranea TaxID=340021 RepID=A0A0P1GSB4_9RHOB|nr:hypothetical protein [Thalassovita mediterranea]CUH85429.1 hypothetical protein TM5383_02663 [Thalassovita mediterranea]SIS31666.1 Uncharacterized conserved protein [Thalassovita mediterranea]
MSDPKTSDDGQVVETEETTHDQETSDQDTADVTDAVEDGTEEDDGSVELSQDTEASPAGEEVQATDEEAALDEADPADAEAVEVEDTAEVEETAEPVSETPEAEPTPVAAPSPAPAKRGGFVPMVLGGVIAAAIGAGAALTLFPNGLSNGEDPVRDQILADLAAQKQVVAALQDQLAAQLADAEESAEIAALNDILSEQTAQQAAQQTRIEMLSQLVGDLEKRPIANALAPEAIAAYQRELTALQEAMALQRAEVEEKLAVSAAQAQSAASRDALILLDQAFVEGTALAPGLDALAAAGQPVPDALKAVRAGVPSVAGLQEAFPDLARQALAADRASGGGAGAVNFLKEQLGVRSLTPQEGDSADAVLSRVEAALKSGDLPATLAEAEALPEAAAAVMGPWVASVAQTLAAETALAELRQSLKTN